MNNPLKCSLKCETSVCYAFVGTGKSTVGAHLAYAYARLNQITKKKTPGQQKNRCVVYCGASNTSVDVVASM